MAIEGYVESISVHAALDVAQGRVAINGVPLIWTEGGESTKSDGSVNEWAKDGLNQVTVRLRWPKERPFVADAAQAVARVTVVPPGSEPDTVEPAVNLFWPPTPPAQEAYPHALQATFALSDFPTTALWSRTKPLDAITPEDRSGIVQVVKDLHAGYSRGEVDAVMQLLRPRIEEMALSYGDAVGERLDSVRRMTTAMFESEGWAVEPIESDQLELELVAEGRLVWVTRPHAAPVIASKRLKTFRWSTHVYVASLSGKWTILR